MASSENSYLGIALQGGFETPNDTDADFVYLLFNRAAGGMNPITLPLPPEVGGGALLRNVVKVGVNSGIQGEFIPRPDSIGFMLLGMTGNVVSTPNVSANYLKGPVTLTGLGQHITDIQQLVSPARVVITLNGTLTNPEITINGLQGGNNLSETIDTTGVSGVYYGEEIFDSISDVNCSGGTGTISFGVEDGSFTHVFTLGNDQFQAPWLTVRNSPGSLWGEIYEDCRFALTTLNFRSPDFVKGAFSLLGRSGHKVDATEVGTWDAIHAVDGGPQFITPTSAIELPLGTGARALQGSFTMLTNIPLDQQYVVGQYFPEGLDIVNRAFSFSLGVKVDDPTLYGKIMFDPDGGDQWVAKVFKEGRVKFYLASAENAALHGTRPYSLKVEANGSAGDAANVVWTASPPEIISQRQLVMNVTGTILANPSGNTPVTITLVNRTPFYGEQP